MRVSGTAPWDVYRWSHTALAVTVSGSFQVDFDSCMNVSDLGTVAVVDGQELLITPLQHTIVPPPMCAARAKFPATIKCLTFLEGMENEASHS